MNQPTNLKAILFSVMVSVIFLFFFALLFRPEQPVKRCSQNSSPSPTPIASPQVQAEAKPPDPNAKFRIIPSNFAHVDFKNRSYGLYRASPEHKLYLKLTNGKYEYSEGYLMGGELFSLRDIYFTDVTGDQIPEAIVLLWHVQCGGSCDGGKALFFVYTNNGKGLKEIWRSETGSYGYGCGLKSLTVMKKLFVIQMFGKCFNPQIDSATQKFLVAGETFSYFRLSGDRFVKRETDFVSAPLRDVKGYQPQIHIIE